MMIAADLGRVFEVGFNVGILTYIQQNQERIDYRFLHMYRPDLQKLRFAPMVEKIWEEEDITSVDDRQVAKKWITFFVQRGFLAGLNFFQEYASYLMKNQTSRNKLEILYYQCNFYNENSLGTSPEDEGKIFQRFLSQFSHPGLSIDHYAGKGEFLRADTLMLLRYKDDVRILSIDLSVFSIQSIKHLVDADEMTLLRHMLRREINRLRSKSIFTGLCIDTESLDFTFSEDLARYLTAFKKEDKESAKLIQAASYAQSFYHFLLSHHILQTDASVIFNVVGYTDRGISTMSLRKERLGVLETCARIYKEQQSDQQIHEARLDVLNIIQRNAIKCFENGSAFISSLLTMPATSADIHSVIHREQLTTYVPINGTLPAALRGALALPDGIKLRDAHATLVTRALAESATFVFLTGHPGIGKTTAIVEHLKSLVDEGFLFLYASPRKQVNMDVLEKFTDPQTRRLCHDKLFFINTNADIIRENDGNEHVVQFFSNRYTEDFSEYGVLFKKEETATRMRKRRSFRLERSMEDEIRDRGTRARGVLDSMCEAIHALIASNRSTAVIATVSLQALKKTAAGDTLERLEKIFKDAYNKRTGEVIPAKMREIAKKIPHIVIMVDEVTGDESGVAFLNGLHRFLHTYGLIGSDYGFQTKVIVADASIVDKGVIEHHLSHSSVEPDKIFFRQVKDDDAPSPLSYQPFPFRGEQAVMVNANSYPAQRLDVEYRIFIEPVEFREDSRPKSNLRACLQEDITTAITAFLDRAGPEQMIVYIQDKSRLAELIEDIKRIRGEERFRKPDDYLEIHASIAEADRKGIVSHKNRAKIIFMTASASRGLSFPLAKRILVDVPRFEVEQNLMEIIQVIYRGRGKDEHGMSLEETNKELVLYLSDQALYAGQGDERELSLRESVLGLLNVLLILKTSIMTRLQGFGKVGYKKFMMIPIGGKSVLTADETFSGRLATLIEALQREHRLHPADKRLQTVYEGLEHLLGRADIVLKKPEKEKGSRVRRTYLSLRDFFNTTFVQIIEKGFDGLLALEHIEPGYVVGSLLIVPLAQSALQENYHLQLGRELRKCEDGTLLRNMLSIREDHVYTQHVRSAIADAVELLDKLESRAMKSHVFYQQSQSPDLYYALPLAVFVSGNAMKQYFAAQKEVETYGGTFRDLLKAHIRTLYPVNTVLPIGSSYAEFPFIIFKSYALGEMRYKMFADKYLLVSNELNILNLLLSH